MKVAASESIELYWRKALLEDVGIGPKKSFAANLEADDRSGLQLRNPVS